MPFFVDPFGGFKSVFLRQAFRQVRGRVCIAWVRTLSLSKCRVILSTRKGVPTMMQGVKGLTNDLNSIKRPF